MRKLMDFITPNATVPEHDNASFQAFLTLQRTLDEVPEQHRQQQAGNALVSLATILFNWVPPEDVPVFLEAVLEHCPGITFNAWPTAATSSQARH